MGTDNKAGMETASGFTTAENGHVIKRIESVTTTLATSSTSVLSKRVMVRDASVSSVSVPYNVTRENERRNNLIANRGVGDRSSTTNE